MPTRHAPRNTSIACTRFCVLIHSEYIQKLAFTARAQLILFRTVLIELPRSDLFKVSDEVNRRTADALAEWLSLRRSELDVADPSLTALDGLTEHALMFRPEPLQSAPVASMAW